MRQLEDILRQAFTEALPEYGPEELFALQAARIEQACIVIFRDSPRGRVLSEPPLSPQPLKTVNISESLINLSAQESGGDIPDCLLGEDNNKRKYAGEDGGADEE